MSSVFVSTSSDDQTLIDNKVTQTEEKNDDQKLIDNEATQTEETSTSKVLRSCSSQVLKMKYLRNNQRFLKSC